MGRTRPVAGHLSSYYNDYRTTIVNQQATTGSGWIDVEVVRARSKGRM
jgi:hypothetical protein